MYLQPTAWMMALFAVSPLTRWLGEGKTGIRPAILSVVLCAGALQAFLSFNLSYKLTFSPAFMRAIELVRQEAEPSDVIAFWPGSLQTRTILSDAPKTNNSFIAALTGLRGYFNSPGYSENFSVASMSSVEPYETRRKIISDLMANKIDAYTVNRLTTQNVRWIILPKQINIPQVENVTTRISEPRLTLLQIRNVGPLRTMP